MGILTSENAQVVLIEPELSIPCFIRELFYAFSVSEGGTRSHCLIKKEIYTESC